MDPRVRGVKQLSRVLGPVSKDPRSRPAVPCDSRTLSRAHGDDHLSWAARALVRGPAVSTCFSGRIALVSEGPRGQPDVSGDSGPGLKACGINQLPRPIALRSKGTRCQPDITGDSGPGPRAHGVVKMSRGSCTHAQGTEVLTSCPRGLGPVSEGQRGRPAVWGETACVQGPAGSTRHSRRLRPGSESLRVQPTVPGDSGPCPRARRVDQLSRATRVRVRGSAWSTSNPR